LTLFLHPFWFIEISGKRYSTWKVLLIPEIETKGLLKPKGKWLVWVDKETNIPVKLSIKFTIGSADVVLEKSEGDLNLFKEVKNGQIELLQRYAK